jgi:hypothetical protein
LGFESFAGGKPLVLRWPDWRCVAIASSGSPCNAPATWQAHPLASSTTVWPYCDRCKPLGAAPIPVDAPYHVTRLELTVALVGASGSRAAATDDAIRRVLYALEDVGGLVVALKVRGRKMLPASLAGPPLRLQLAGRPESIERRRPLLEALSSPAEPWRWGKRRTG